MIDYDTLFSEVGSVYHHAVRVVEEEDYDAVARIPVHAAPDTALTLIQRLTRCALRHGIDVRYEKWDQPERLGCFDRTNRVITINTAASLTKRAYALMHELCHNFDPELPTFSLGEMIFGSPRIHQLEIATDAANVLLLGEAGIDALAYGAYYIAAHQYQLSRYGTEPPTRERILAIYDAVTRDLEHEERIAA